MQDDLAALKVYDIGKPIVIEETFPLTCSMKEFESFIIGSRDTAEGWISHYFGKSSADYRQEKDWKSTLIAECLEFWQRAKPADP